MKNLLFILLLSLLFCSCGKADKSGDGASLELLPYTITYIEQSCADSYFMSNIAINNCVVDFTSEAVQALNDRPVAYENLTLSEYEYEIALEIERILEAEIGRDIFPPIELFYIQ